MGRPLQLVVEVPKETPAVAREYLLASVPPPTYAIVEKSNNLLIGAIGLTINSEFERAELGDWIGEPYWGLGYCSEAAQRIVRYGFEDLGLNRIHAWHLARNPASGRVLQKIGMSNEGIARQHTRKHGKFEDIVLCGLLREDYAE